MASTFSEEGEKLHEEAAALVRREVETPRSVKKNEFLAMDAKMRDRFAEDDPEWVVWRMLGRKRGWLA
jgi:hypothetical protein